MQALCYATAAALTSGIVGSAQMSPYWLPAPADAFILMMRLYWPKEKPPSLLDGTWKIPEVKEAS
jgi:hypothetical protein